MQIIDENFFLRNHFFVKWVSRFALLCSPHYSKSFLIEIFSQKIETNSSCKNPYWIVCHAHKLCTFQYKRVGDTFIGNLQYAESRNLLKIPFSKRQKYIAWFRVNFNYYKQIAFRLITWKCTSHISRTCRE